MAKLVIGTDKTVVTPALVKVVSPEYYIEKEITPAGVLQPSTTSTYLMDFSTVKSIGDYGLTGAYKNNTGISSPLDFSLLESAGQYALFDAFNGATGITSVDLSSLTTIPNQYSFYQAFKGATGITSVDLSSLEIVSGNYTANSMFMDCTNLTNLSMSNLSYVSSQYGCTSMFRNCTSLTSVSLPNLYTVSGQYGCSGMFYGCTGLTSIDISSLENLTQNGASYSCQLMFYGCTGLTSVDLSSLLAVDVMSGTGSMFSGCTNLTSADLSGLIQAKSTQAMAWMFSNTNLSTMEFTRLTRFWDNSSGSSILQSAFSGCTNLTSVSFPGFAYATVNCNDAFREMLSGTSNVTVHFPSDWQTDMSTWSNVQNGFSGTNTTVLFDLPPVTKFDFSHIKHLKTSLYNFASNNKFPNVTSVDLSNLETVTGSFSQAFMDCTGLTSVDLSKLKVIDGGSGSPFSKAFMGCTGLTSVDLSSLEEVNPTNNYNSRTFDSAFKNCTGITSVDLSGLDGRKMGSYAFNQAFVGCTGLTSVDLSNLTIFKTSYAFSGMFNGCTSLTSFDLGRLVLSYGTSQYNGYAFSGMFSGCTSLTTFRFDSLKEVTTDYTFMNTFTNCTSLTDIYFPALKNVAYSYSSQWSYTLSGTDGVTIHAPSNLNRNIFSTSAISNMHGTNTTVLYDLPAVVILTGANSQEYERNPKYDTVSALAWRIKDTGTAPDLIIDFTPFYTSTTADPTVGSTIYSDSACTTSVTTISSIA